MGKFTKGPWVRSNKCSGVILIKSKGDKLKYWESVASVGGAASDENASLIACAPEMYEMLEQSREMLLNFHRNTGSLGAKAKADEIQSLLKRARGE